NAIDTVRQIVEWLFLQYQYIEKQLKEQNIGEDERIREIEFLKYEMQEIEAAHLREGEEEELEMLYNKISHAKDILSVCGSVYDLTSGNSLSAESMLGKGIRSLSDIADLDAPLTDLMDQLSGVEGLLNDFNRDLSEYMSSMEFDEETYVETEERLDLINRLKAKYGDSISSIIMYKEKAEERLDILLHFDEMIDRLKRKKTEVLRALDEENTKLSALRKEAAVPLAESIKTALLDLNFDQVRFEIAFSDTATYSANGTDHVCFMISTNPGTDMRPLHEIASGGELSRIMLAIKSVLADEEQVETLIFDEIDAGISGRTA
ncbi:MAG: DNA repair protein RecN, partial [Clostridiales bacterium]|nr:DNA repair protein RecN [Clostridiales bacterium]